MLRWFRVSTLLIVLLPPARGQGPAAPPPVDVRVDPAAPAGTGGPKSPNTAAEMPPAPTVGVTAQMQADAVWVGQDAANREVVGEIPDGAAFRRGRIGAFGNYGPAEYRAVFDFALAGRPSVLDLYAAVNTGTRLGQVRVGHFFEPFSLERYSQNRFVTYLERSLADAPFAPARNMGVMALGFTPDKRTTWAAGVFQTDSDAFGDDTGTDFRSAATARVTHLVWYDEATGADYLQLGGAYSARATKAGVTRFRTQPEVRLGAATPNIPDFADTGALAADRFHLLGGEVLLVRGPWSLQAEGVAALVRTVAAGWRTFHSGYVSGTVFLTGEHRPVQRETGTLGRIVPERDFAGPGGTFASGPGAVELALRLSHVDLIDGPVQGGRVTDITVGVNWYLNPFLRVTANYIRVMPGGGRPKGVADFFGVRVGYDF